MTGATGTQQGTGTPSGVFPFKLEDLKAWIVHRKDGTITRFTLVQSSVQASTGTRGTTQATAYSRTQEATTQVAARTVSGVSGYCSHKPDVNGPPEAQFDRNGNPLRLWVASMGGAKAVRDNFDYVLDCGDIWSDWELKHGGVLNGPGHMVEKLGQFAEGELKATVLKVDWYDRKAPRLAPGFWPELNKLVKGDMFTACVGGHGRSGTSFVCLLLVNAPDYDAWDAIVHLRAVHCPRAIESQEQHEYIDKVAAYLGRKTGAKAAIHDVTDYKEAFKASTKPTAIATRKYLGWDK